jgi:CHASE3 domain sensor protein
MDLELRSPKNAELIKSLRELNISDDEIIKSLNIPEESIVTDQTTVVEKSTDTIVKSIEEQIAEKQAELEKLQELQKAEKPEALDLGMFDEKFEDISKSLTSKFEDTNTKFDGLVGLVKSLTENVIGLKETNEKLIEDNQELRKSLSSSEEILNKLAAFTPGLQSLKTNPNFVNRFEKSVTDDGKDIMSVSRQKDEISALLAKKMDDPEFAKSFGSDIASFECSTKISPRLEKALVDDLNVKLVQ